MTTPIQCSAAAAGADDHECAPSAGPLEYAVIGMWDDEIDHPWTAALLYAAAIIVALLASHFAAMGAA